MPHSASQMNPLSMPKFGEIPQAPIPAQLKGYASITETGGRTFGETMTSMIGKANDIMSQPEKLTMQAVTTGNVDIHEVMIAMGKSEVAFKLLTAVAQKGISGFDKLTNMQV